MTIHVILDIVPQRLERDAWAEAFEETLRLLAAHPARLLGYGFRVASGVRVPVFTRRVEQGGNDPAERRWCVVGDRTTLGTGERQRMYRDLARYAVQSPTAGAALAADDVLVAAATAPPPPRAEPVEAPSPADRAFGPGASALGTVRVFGEGDQSEPCGLPLLAAAMVVESRFPRYALVSGRFDREQAEVARRWASAALGRAVTLPVRVDAFRIVERLGARLEGAALLEAVDGLFLAPHGAREAALLRLFGRAVAEPWYLEKLRAHASPDVAEARRALAAYLDATHDLPRLAMLACLDGRGPRWDRSAFVEALAALPDPRGGPRPRFDPPALQQALRPLLGRDAFAETRAGPPTRAPLAPPPGAGATTERARSIEALACVTSPGELDAENRARVLAVVSALRDAQARHEEQGPVSASSARRVVVGLLARGGPTLTEDAWEWIERETDPELCTFLCDLAALVPASAEQAAVRRALLENRALCRHAAGLARGEAPVARRPSSSPPPPG